VEALLQIASVDEAATAAGNGEVGPAVLAVRISCVMLYTVKKWRGSPVLPLMALGEDTISIFTRDPHSRSLVLRVAEDEKNN
jgi:hypothetical protein